MSPAVITKLPYNPRTEDGSQKFVTFLASIAHTVSFRRPGPHIKLFLRSRFGILNDIRPAVMRQFKISRLAGIRPRPLRLC